MPEAFLEPLQPPEAVQAVALVEDQVSCVLPPLFTVVGFALSVAVGTGGAFTATVTLCVALVPPGPVHCAENVLFVVMLLIVVVPEGATVPLQSPDPAHEVASVDAHVSCVLPPLATDIGFALSVNVGNGMDEESSPSPQPASTSAAAVRLTAAALRNMANRGTAKKAALRLNRRRFRLRHAAARARNPTLSQLSDPPPPEPLSPPPPGVTVTSALSLALPPAPLQVRVN